MFQGGCVLLGGNGVLLCERDELGICSDSVALEGACTAGNGAGCGLHVRRGGAVIKAAGKGGDARLVGACICGLACAEGGGGGAKLGGGRGGCGGCEAVGQGGDGGRGGGVFDGSGSGLRGAVRLGGTLGEWNGGCGWVDDGAELCGQ